MAGSSLLMHRPMGRTTLTDLLDVTLDDYDKASSDHTSDGDNTAIGLGTAAVSSVVGLCRRPSDK